MEEISTFSKTRNYRPIVLGSIVLGVFIIFAVLIFSFFKKQSLVSPLEEQDAANVKVIFVTPEPSTAPLIGALESSPSATPKSSPKPKASPKVSATPANSATPSASPN